jgi:hypothetical protein
MIGVSVAMLAAGIAAMASAPGFDGPRDTVPLIATDRRPRELRQ